MEERPQALPKRFWFRQAVETITLTLLMILIIRTAVQNFRIQGPSMEPTLHDQEFVLVDKAAYLFHPPARGDIIVFEYPYNIHENYIKRIIAIPGDIISVMNETVIVNGVTLQEQYVNKNDPYNPYPSFMNHIVGPNEYFVMGDNRGDSSDSRDWGLVPRQNIIGRVTFIYWPLRADNFGIPQDYSSVFAKVHQ